MGNLNQFYLMGRVARPPVDRTSPRGPMVCLLVRPGTGRAAKEREDTPVEVEATGPQIEAARALHVGQAVLLRGHLRQEGEEGAGRLVARVQAIELLAGSAVGHAAAEAGLPASGPRRRRRRGRRRGEGGPDEPGGEGAPGEERRERRPSRAPAGAASDGGTEAPPVAAEARPPVVAREVVREAVRESLPPPTPIAKRAPAPPPDPTYRKDMPF